GAPERSCRRWRRRNRKIRHAGNRPRPRSSFIDDPGAQSFFGFRWQIEMRRKMETQRTCGNCRSPWKSAVVGLRHFLLMISTDCLEKPTQQTLRLFHSYHRPAVINYLGTLKSRNPKTRLPDPAAKE